MRVWAVFHPRQAALRVVWQAAALVGVAVTLTVTLRGGRGWIGPWPGTAGLGALFAGSGPAPPVPAGHLRLLIPNAANGPAAVRVYVDGLQAGVLASGPLALSVRQGDVIALRSLAETPVDVRVLPGASGPRWALPAQWTVPPHDTLTLPPVSVVTGPAVG